MSVDRDKLVAYSLGAVTEAEERAVVEHLRSNPQDAAFVRDLFESLAEVALSEAPVEVPAGSADALLARIKPVAIDTPDPARRRAPPATFWGGLAAAAVVVILALTLLRPFDPNARIEARLDRTCAVAGNLCEELVGVDDLQLGTLARRADGTSLVVLGQAPPSGREYQAWEIVAGEPRSLGVFESRWLELGTPLSVGGLFAVTIEPPGGSPLPTTEPIVVVEI